MYQKKMLNCLNISYIRWVLTLIATKLILRLNPNDSAYRWPTGILFIILAEKKQRALGNSPAVISEDLPPKLDIYP